MSIIDRNYKNKIAEVEMIVSETEFVASMQSIVEFGNKWIMKSAKLSLKLADDGQ